MTPPLLHRSHHALLSHRCQIFFLVRKRPTLSYPLFHFAVSPSHPVLRAGPAQSTADCPPSSRCCVTIPSSMSPAPMLFSHFGVSPTEPPCPAGASWVGETHWEDLVRRCPPMSCHRPSHTSAMRVFQRYTRVHPGNTLAHSALGRPRGQWAQLGQTMDTMLGRPCQAILP
jgi:hypothetical protein